jgi:hypothetical protein
VAIVLSSHSLPEFSRDLLILFSEYRAAACYDYFSPALLISKKNPAIRNRARDHRTAAEVHSQMLYQLSYSRLVNHERSRGISVTMFLTSIAASTSCIGAKTLGTPVDSYRLARNLVPSCNRPSNTPTSGSIFSPTTIISPGGWRAGRAGNARKTTGFYGFLAS